MCRLNPHDRGIPFSNDSLKGEIQEMHVLMISDMEAVGGASIAASSVAEGLNTAGCQVTRLVWKSDGKPHSWATIELSQRRSIAQRAMSRFIPFLRRSIKTSSMNAALEQTLTMLKPDLIHIHNIHESRWPLDYVKICSDTAPTVWTLHDMWSMTGRCVYSYDCERYISGCDAHCPTPTEYPALKPLEIAPAWNEKKRILREHPQIVGVAPSRWLAAKAKDGIWKANRLVHIPWGVPQDAYRIINRETARDVLGLNVNDRILMAAADNLLDRRKGGEFLEQALSLGVKLPVTLLTIGTKSLRVAMPGVKYIHFGYVASDRLKALLYNAANVFVHPAPVEVYGLVVAEALACGTAVVGFPVGGVPELVRPGITGWLGKEVSPRALAEAINQALDETQASDHWRYSCRTLAEKELTLTQQNDRYLQLFRSLAKVN
jgi:glycosyltransferase involved in cell wall biosynthesis